MKRPTPAEARAEAGRAAAVARMLAVLDPGGTDMEPSPEWYRELEAG